MLRGNYSTSSQRVPRTRETRAKHTGFQQQTPLATLTGVRCYRFYEREELFFLCNCRDRFVPGYCSYERTATASATSRFGQSAARCGRRQSVGQSRCQRRSYSQSSSQFTCIFSFEHRRHFISQGRRGQRKGNRFHDQHGERKSGSAVASKRFSAASASPNVTGRGRRRRATAAGSCRASRARSRSGICVD